MSGSRQSRVGRHIRLGRERVSMTRSQLAEKSGCPLDVIVGLEAGTEDCSTGLLARIATALGMRLDLYLMPLESSNRLGNRHPSQTWLREPISQRINFLQQLLPGIDSASHDMNQPEWWRMREAEIATELREDIRKLERELDDAI